MLKRYFGHSAFRPGQETLIDGLLSGRDVLGVMPTGAGKSMCYQIPALAMEGMTLVISPLISLMADQVAALNQAGVPGAYLNSALDLEAYQEVLQGIRRGIYKLLYVAPERLTVPAFLAALARTTVSLVAVDEAHCVSQWGQDFRPSYLKIPEFLEQLPARPVVGAFTATATAQVKADIIQMLGLRAPEIVTTGFDRPNLYFGVVRPPGQRRLAPGICQRAGGKERHCLLRHPEKCGVRVPAAPGPGLFRHPLSRGAAGSGAAGKPGGLRL